MSGSKDQEVTHCIVKGQDGDAIPVEKKIELDKNGESSMPSSQQEEEVIKKKYGGMIPKKVPLISKDHERAFFDSADWALGKQGAQKPKGPLEALRPKLQPTNQQVRSRRPAYGRADADADDDGEDSGSNDETQRSMDQSGSLEGGDDNTTTTTLKD